MNFRKLLTYLTVGTAAVIPFAGAQNPTILQGNYITNVFGNSNFVLNPNAQTNIANVTTVTATVTRSTTTPLVATSEFTVAIGTANGTATWATRAFDQGMKGQNCEARFSYRGFAATSKVHIKQGANTVATLTLTPSTDPRIASINFPCGDLSAATTFQVTDTAILAGTNEIGGIYVGLATNMANVAQAETVVIANVNAQVTVAPSTYTNVPYQSESLDAFGEYNNTTGVFTAKRAGNYFVAASLFWLNSTWGASNIYLNVFKNGSLIVENLRQISAGTFYYIQESSVSISLAVGDTLVVSAYQSDTANRFIASNSTFSRLSISRFPSSSELVVTPERQNVFATASWPVGNTGSIYSFSTTSTTAQNVINTGFASGSASYYGAAAASATTNGYGMKVNNIPPGVYRITAQVSVSQTSGYDCQAELHDNSGRIGSVNSGLNTKSGLVVIYRVTSFQTSQDFLIKLRSDNASTTCSVNVGNGGNFNPSIVFEPLDQPSNSALYVQGPVLGAQTGATLTNAYIGYAIPSASSSLTNQSNGASRTGNGISLPPGIWLIHVKCSVGAIAPTKFECAIATAVNGGGVTDSRNMSTVTTFVDAGNTAQAGDLRTLGYFVVPTTTTYYPTVFAYTPSGTTYSFGYEISAIRLN